MDDSSRHTTTHNKQKSFHKYSIIFIHFIHNFFLTDIFSKESLFCSHITMASFNDLSYSWLDDFDWSLRMVMSSDKLSDLHKPLLMLSLETTNANGEKSSQLLELTTEELKYLIGKLKTVQKVNKWSK